MIDAMDMLRLSVGVPIYSLKDIISTDLKFFVIEKLVPVFKAWKIRICDQYLKISAALV